MIVKELIAKLKKLNQDAIVYYPEDEDFHAMDFQFVAKISYRGDTLIILGDKPDDENDGELIPFSQINVWGMLS